MSAQRGRSSLTRTQDYLYDSVYTVCSAKAHFRAANAAARNREVSEKQKPMQVAGQDRHLFFRRPIVPFLPPETTVMEFSGQLDCAAMEGAMLGAQERCYGLPSRLEPQTKATQTDYRESEAQTSPWEPPYKVPPGHNPEVLTLAHLTWGHGLPAGMHEVTIINRMRMKRAWEAILPPMDSPANIKTRTAIISALEVNDWAFREAEIQFIMDMRMELMENLSRAREKEHKKQAELRLQRFGEILENRRDKEVQNIRHKLGRELRKLAVKHRSKKSGWYKKHDIIRDHADPSSELHAPQMRFGENPQRRHEMLRKKLLKENYIDDAEKEDTTPSCLPTYEQLKAVKPKQKPAELCIRETRWNEGKLRQLHADLKEIRINRKPTATISLMKRKSKAPPLPSTPVRQDVQDLEEELDQSSIFIQKTVRGRAVQCVMFEGRDRCRELIEELQSTHALHKHAHETHEIQKGKAIGLQQDQSFRILQENRMSEILDSLEGMTVSGMLDFLSKELIRLQDERKAHAFALLAERERNKREAEEAGRRQLEEHRRRELDEMFKQTMKVNQDSVETYLEDIIKEGVDWVSDKQAKQYIVDLADKVDQASKYANDNAGDLIEEEMVSDMIYNFVLPEVDKQILRKKMREKQQSYLKIAHEAIYDEISKLSPEEHSVSHTQSYVEEIESYEEEKGESRETSEEWTRRRIVDEVIDSEETLTGSILDLIISRAIQSDGEKVVISLLEDVISQVVDSCELALGSNKRSSSCSSSTCSSTSSKDGHNK